MDDGGLTGSPNQGHHAKHPVRRHIKYVLAVVGASRLLVLLRQPTRPSQQLSQLVTDTGRKLSATFVTAETVNRLDKPRRNRWRRMLWLPDSALIFNHADPADEPFAAARWAYGAPWVRPST